MKVRVSSGESLADALKKQQFYMDMPCGGIGSCGGCTVEIREIGRVLACQYRRPGEYEVILPQERLFDAVVSGRQEMQNAQGAEHADAPCAPEDCTYLAVLDLGTTTAVAGVFYQGKSHVFSFTNPQRAYGADVMSRIRQACEGQADILRQLVWERLQKVLEEAEAAWDIPEGESPELVLSANTTMQHLFEGLSCSGLGAAPFAPADISLHTYQLPMRGRSGASRMLRVTSLPGISAFVGADIVSGIYEVGMMQEAHPALLLDLGTNGEMALGCGEKLLVASTAAGPAFEGSGLALRLHGAGILKLLHHMLSAGVMDETGLLADPYFDTGYPVPEEVFEQAGGLRITQEEIRELQMAKAAICAGIRILLKEYEIGPEAVAKVYLAGGMGYYLAPQDAFAVGLLPREFAGRTQAVGNTSYLGAVRYAADRAAAGSCMEQIVRTAREIVLSDHPLFETCYIDAMNFPEPGPASGDSGQAL